MTDLVQAKEAIYKKFGEEWVLPATYDNESYDPPQGVWARLSIRHRPGGQETLGKPGQRKFTRRAAAFVQIFGPLGKGSSATDAAMKAAVAIFEGRAAPLGTTIRFLEVIPREIGEDQNSRWWTSTVEAIFEYEELK